MIDHVRISLFHRFADNYICEVALGRKSEYPRVAFRGYFDCRILGDDRASVRDVVESIAEELFNVAGYANGPVQTGPVAFLGGSSEGTAQLELGATLDGGGRGGAAGIGQPSEARRLEP